MKAMWKLKELLEWSSQTEINGEWVPARPLNYQPEYCSIWKRLRYAWQVVLGRHETFEWPEGQK